jgi:hypothetical protein
MTATFSARSRRRARSRNSCRGSRRCASRR